MAKAWKHGGYAFGEFRLDPEKRMLYRGDAEVSLPPKVIETLIVLVENQGEIVSKADLMEKVWADSIVEESNLSQHLYLLRKTLGNASDGRPMIETLRRRGYRFNANATVIEAEAQPEPHLLPRASSGHFAVKRRGNVLTVSDWEAAPEQRAPSVDDRPPLESVAEAAARLAILKRSTAVFLAVAVVVTAYFLWPRQNAVNVTAEGDIATSFLTNGRPVEGVTISPDGNYFVYHETETPVSRLWLQQTGQSGRFEIIPAAERTIGPKTFSPDGQFIYFISREKSAETDSLYRVPTLGGPHAKVLENVSTPVAFSPDGEDIAFVRFNKELPSAELVTASSDGHGERVLLKREGSQSSLGIGTAWSPDGRRIAYALLEMDELQRGYFSLSAVELSDGETVALSPERWDTCYRMQWTSDGKGLVFIGTRDGESLSARRDQVYYLSYPGAQARKITNEGNRHDPSSLGITSENDILVLPFGRSSQIWSMDASGDSRTAVQITKGLLDGRSGIAPLPDGRVGYIARTGENVNLWIMNADGTDQRQLTSDPSLVEEARASPDGSFLVFSAVKGRRSYLFRIDPDGGGQIQISTGGTEVDSSVSPDGAWIVFAAALFDGVYGKTFIWKAPSSGGPAEKVGSAECASPQFSPDGGSISCISGDNRIMILRAADGAVISTFEARPRSRLNFGARWTPDGGSLAYTSVDRGTANIWLQPVQGGTPARLTDFSGGDIYNFAFSLDGERIFLARGHPIHDAMLISDFK